MSGSFRGALLSRDCSQSIERERRRPSVPRFESQRFEPQRLESQRSLWGDVEDRFTERPAPSPRCAERTCRRGRGR